MQRLVNSNDVTLDRVGKAGMFLSRLTIGFLWYQQLLWKLPPTFGCPPNFAVSTSFQHRTSGLCDWVGLMTIYSKIPLQASLVKTYVVPNISWVGWFIFIMEAFITATLILGLFTRLSGLVGIVQALNLYFGITSVPGEWYWSYGMLATLGLVFLAVPAGRILGLDAWLRPRLQAGAGKGNRLAKVLLLFT